MSDHATLTREAMLSALSGAFRAAIALAQAAGETAIADGALKLLLDVQIAQREAGGPR